MHLVIIIISFCSFVGRIREKNTGTQTDLREPVSSQRGLFLCGKKECKALFSYDEIYTFRVNQLRENQFTAINPFARNARCTINCTILCYISKLNIFNSF